VTGKALGEKGGESSDDPVTEDVLLFLGDGVSDPWDLLWFEELRKVDCRLGGEGRKRKKSGERKRKGKWLWRGEIW